MLVFICYIWEQVILDVHRLLMYLRIQCEILFLVSNYKINSHGEILSYVLPIHKIWNNYQKCC